MAQHGFVVTEDINGAHPRMPNYSLFEGDLLVDYSDGTWGKIAPGIAVVGFRFTNDQVASLKPVTFMCEGLTFQILEEETP